MILITGGAAQGKQSLIREKYHIKMTDGAVCKPEEAMTAACIIHYHLLVKRLTESGLDPLAWTAEFCKQNPACIVSINEIGSGIIPLEKADRILRENTGRCGCLLAEHAETVIRVTCGIPLCIKGKML